MVLGKMRVGSCISPCALLMANSVPGVRQSSAADGKAFARPFVLMHEKSVVMRLHPQ